jgi:hypothetical protein
LSAEAGVDASVIAVKMAKPVADGMRFIGDPICYGARTLPKLNGDFLRN